MRCFSRAATGRVPHDFAGSEERSRGGRAALSELAKASEFAALPRRRAGWPPVKSNATERLATKNVPYDP